MRQLLVASIRLSLPRSLSLYLSFFLSQCPFAIRLLINQTINFNWFDGDLWHFLNLAEQSENTIYVLMFIYCTYAVY